MPWSKLDSIQSRGSQAEKPGSLGNLHATRELTLSQFFTPNWLTSFLWDSIKPAFSSNHYYSLFDNSVGSAGLFRYANPSQFSLNGIDTDRELINQVTKILDKTEFSLDLQCAAMENVVLGEFSCGIINPPFSITLSSANLTPFPGVTCFGRFGPDTSALSHLYSLMQALTHCDIVAAIVPRSVLPVLENIEPYYERLSAVFTLPNNTFRDENVDSVDIVLLIFNAISRQGDIIYRTIDPQSKAESIPGLHCRYQRALGTGRHIQVLGADNSKSVVILPPTDDKRVLMTRANRHIKLRFFDGATEANVFNKIYRARLFSTTKHRYPSTTKYSGQHLLNLDVIVLQDDPFSHLENLKDLISSVGGIPFVMPDLKFGLRAMIKQHKKMMVPFGRTVYRKGTPSFTAKARKMGLLNHHQTGAAVSFGEQVNVLRVSQGFEVTCKKGVFTCDHDRFFGIFDMEGEAKTADYWEEVCPPIKSNYPQEIAAIETKAKSLGLDKWLTWDFQFNDLCEHAFRKKGSLCAYFMGLGKSRMILSLSLLLNGYSLVIVKSRLLDEMQREIDTLNIPKEQYHFIHSLSDLDNLKKINIISYERLRRPIDKRFPKFTIARRAKNIFSNILADEGSSMSSLTSNQSHEIRLLGGKRKIAFDGSMFSEYARQAMGLACWVFGESRSYQPYSLRGEYIERNLINGAFKQKTGRQTFLDHFSCFEWVTREFEQTEKGAKREVPRINPNNLDMFRDWISPIIKRRVQQEPAVKKHVTFPIPEMIPPMLLDWDYDHLTLYIKAVEDFANWYKNYVENQNENKRGLSLVIILARLEACFKACNVPSAVEGFASPYTKLTSKDRACIELVKSLIDRGRRPIVFARSPITLERLSIELTKAGISNLVFTGKETIKKRLARLNKEIRNGNCQVMLASMGSSQDGLNLHQMDTALFYNRSFVKRVEEQCVYRIVRPLQKSKVEVYTLILKGSIDLYMSQLIEWKNIANSAGIDFGEQPIEEDFAHFDNFIHQFLESVPALKNQLHDSKYSSVA